MTHRELVKTIRQRMKIVELTPYQLHQELGGKLSKQTVYNFLEHGKPVRTDKLLAVLNHLNLAVTEAPQKRKHRLTTKSR
jgi:hypothetical protein